MGTVLYLSFLLLIYCLSRAARGQTGDDEAALDPDSVPDSVRQTIRRAARGIVVADVRVARHGAAGVRYQVCGVMPDGRAVELDVHGDGTVYLRDRGQASQRLPAAVSQRLRRSLPSFRPKAETVRCVSDDAAVWYEMDGLVSGDQPASLKISPDGKAYRLELTPLPGQPLP